MRAVSVGAAAGPGAHPPGLWGSLQVFGATKGLAEHLGKTVSLSLDRPGFIVNRILMPMINEAFFVLMEARPPPAPARSCSARFLAACQGHPGQPAPAPARFFSSRILAAHQRYPRAAWFSTQCSSLSTVKNATRLKQVHGTMCAMDPAGLHTVCVCFFVGWL
jgi:hypothetical protein